MALAVAGVGVISITGSPQVAHALAPSVNWDKVRADIVAIIDAEDKRRTDGSGIGPTLVRLGWHASGTYSKADGTGGSNGATMRFCPEGNASISLFLSLCNYPPIYLFTYPAFYLHSTSIHKSISLLVYILVVTYLSIYL